jgi:hypothetical protein
MDDQRPPQSGGLVVSVADFKISSGRFRPVPGPVLAGFDPEWPDFEIGSGRI